MVCQKALEAAKERQHIQEVLEAKVIKVKPDDVKRKLLANKDKVEKGIMELHNESLCDMQDQIKEHVVLLAEAQVLQKALRDREEKKHRAQETVMEMFVTRCLSTGCAWLLQAFGYQLIVYIMNQADPGDPSDPLRVWVGYCIYACFVLLLVPPAQFMFAKKGSDWSPRLASLRRLQAKAWPMTIAWAIKDVVAKFLAYTNQTFWDELVVAIVVTLLVTAVNAIPAVVRATSALKSKPPQDSVCIRYLNVPNTFLLAVGYSINTLARFAVTELSEYTTEKLPQGATNVLSVVVQTIYWAGMSAVILKINSWWHESQEEKKHDDHKTGEHAALAEFEHECEHDVMQTLTAGLGFVYGWGLSDTLRAIYYPFFMGCKSYRTCSYQQVWYYAILVTGVLGVFTSKLSTQEYRSASSKSYQSLMLTAMALTVGWAWMNVFESTTTYFIAQWQSVYDFGWIPLVCYMSLLIFAYVLMSEMYFALKDEMRVVKRSRSEFIQAYPCDPESMVELFRALEAERPATKEEGSTEAAV
eukprot:gb/GFBE01010462.1/.p1 GENE.gb/GFBE01010462.1/~~gb/GFBE01010462.1/.p1  ORF type:complete len:528 (+),score=135.06 gb/GFBE01010462.1/:1-1584(+)